MILLAMQLITKGSRKEHLVVTAKEVETKIRKSRSNHLRNYKSTLEERDAEF